MTLLCTLEKNPNCIDDKRSKINDVNILRKFLQEYHQSLKPFGSSKNVGPDLCPNYLQILPADDTTYSR